MNTSKELELSTLSTSVADVLSSGTAEFHVDLPVECFAEAERIIWHWLKGSPEFARMCNEHEGDEPLEVELRAKLAIFWALFKQLPMGLFEHFRWMAEYGESQGNPQIDWHIEDFAIEALLKKLSRPGSYEELARLREKIDARLEEQAAA